VVRANKLNTNISLR